MLDGDGSGWGEGQFSIADQWRRHRKGTVECDLKRWERQPYGYLGKGPSRKSSSSEALRLSNSNKTKQNKKPGSPLDGMEWARGEELMWDRKKHWNGAGRRESWKTLQPEKFEEYWIFLRGAWKTTELCAREWLICFTLFFSFPNKNGPWHTPVWKLSALLGAWPVFVGTSGSLGECPEQDASAADVQCGAFCSDSPWIPWLINWENNHTSLRICVHSAWC